MNKDMQFLIECLASELVQMLMDKYGWDMRRAFDELYASRTFALVNDERSGLYYQGAVYVFDFLTNEIETGRVA